jgi:hypothetical protein
VFGIVGNVGTRPVVAIPYALERKMLFFGAFTGASILRNDPPDRYVFNYRELCSKPTPSFDIWSRYAGCSRQIAVFAQQLQYGDASLPDGEGFSCDGRERRHHPPARPCAKHRGRGRCGQPVEGCEDPHQGDQSWSTYRAAARFIEKTRDLYPGMIYTNVVRRLHGARRGIEAVGRATPAGSS